MTYHLLLFILVAAAAMAAVMARSLLLSAIMLALVSVGAALILFDFQAPWAAVFELSVCAGLITVLFVSAVSLFRHEEGKTADLRARFYAMPLVMGIAAIAAWFYAVPFFESLENWARFGSRANSLGSILWDIRRFDLLGQISILAAGVFVINSIFPRRKRQK
ncbi:MAG: NADH-quinone oxidoreductase subunit J [Elusimicrobiales bacterium]|jgi:NADH-quinone oxidoreductase subunit J